MRNLNIALAVVVPVILVILLNHPFHTIHEGHVGIYWRFGALSNKVTEPGLHMHNPFATRIAQVQVTLQTDTVREIPCGTSGGVMIFFDKIEVCNAFMPFLPRPSLHAPMPSCPHTHAPHPVARPMPGPFALAPLPPDHAPVRCFARRWSTC